MKQNQFLAIVMIISLASCINQQKIKIAFLLPNLTDARYPKDKECFLNKAAQSGITVEVADANNDAGMQETQAIKMIDEGVDILVLAAVNQNTAASIVRYAHEKGVCVLGYERLIKNCKLDYIISFDHLVVGKQQAAYAVEHVPAGNYVLIGGDKSDQNAEMIMKGQMTVLEPFIKSSKIKILYSSYVEDWSPDNAYYEIKRIINLSGKKIDVVLSANDGMADGVIRAIKELQPDHPVLITGLDADLAACKRIITGDQTMTVYKPFKTQAELALDLAIKIARHEKVENNTVTFNGDVNVPTTSLNGVVIDKSNLRNTIIKDNYIKENELFK